MRHFSAIEIEWDRTAVYIGFGLYLAATAWLFYIALEPYVRRFWPQLLIGWTRLLSGRVRDPLVGRDVLVGVAAGTIGALLLLSREILPRLLGVAPGTPSLPTPFILQGGRHTLSIALQTFRPALTVAMQCVAIVVLLRIAVKRTWLVLVLGSLLLLPTAMSGTFAGEQLAIELAISLTGIAIIFAVLFRFGLLALVVMFYTFITIDAFPLTTDVSRPYASASLLVALLIATVSAYGFYASRGDEPLFGRDLLD